MAEVRIHVPAEQFDAMVKIAEELGLRVVEQPYVRWRLAVVLTKQ